MDIVVELTAGAVSPGPNAGELFDYLQSDYSVASVS